MHTIKPIAHLSHNEVVELARAAADREDREANPFDPRGARWQLFEDSYRERQAELCTA